MVGTRDYSVVFHDVQVIWASPLEWVIIECHGCSKYRYKSISSFGLVTDLHWFSNL